MLYCSGCGECLHMKETPEKVLLSMLKVNTPEKAVDIMKNMITNVNKEHLILLCFNNKLDVIYREVVHIGTLDATMMHPRDVFRPAIHFSASCVMIGHNHPSGRCEPSEEDLKAAKKLRKAGDLLGIELLDSIIFSSLPYNIPDEPRLVSIKDRWTF